MTSSIDFFMRNFKIINQIVTTGINGFSAITYQLQNDIAGTDCKKDQVFVSYRGTEQTQIGDLLSDFKLFWSSDLGWPGSQEAQAVEYLREVVKEHNNVVVCGHSLGGYLAARSFYYLSKEDAGKVKEVFTFNGAGFGVFSLNSAFFLRKEYADKVENIFAYRGWEVTTGNLFDFLKGTSSFSLFKHLGKRTQTFTENPGWIANHSMSLLTTSLGFYSTLETLIDNLDVLKDKDGKTLEGTEKLTYAIEKIFMSSVGFEDDYGATLIDIAYSITESFGIKSRVMEDGNDTNAESVISKFIELQEYFVENQNLKIRLIGNSDSVSEPFKDTNRNRSLMYALINNLAYYAVVPESFREGIYDRNIVNDMYNIENYSPEYLSYRTAFNQVYSYVLEAKITRTLPSSISFKDIYINGLVAENNKFVFGEQLNAININKNELIYINTDKEESEGLNIPNILFKNYFSSSISSLNDNTIIFGSSSNDLFRIAHNDVTLNLMSGNNIVNIDVGTNNSLIVVGNKTKSVLIYNDKLENNLIIKLDSYKLLETIFKKTSIYKDRNAMGGGSVQDSLILSCNGQKIEIFGKANFLIEGVIYKYEDIMDRVDLFEAVFTEGYYIALNNELIKKHIDNTQTSALVDVKSLNTISVSKKALNANDANKLKSNLEKIMLSKTISSKMSLRAFSIEEPIVYGVLPSATYGELSAYIDSRIIEGTNAINNLPDVVNEKIIPLLMNNIENPFTKVFLNEKLESFTKDKYSGNLILKYPNTRDEQIMNLYYVTEENLGYTITQSDGRVERWLWDGSINLFWDYTTRLMDLNDTKILLNRYRRSVTILSDDNNISGTDGSDILSGAIVDAQSPYYGKYTIKKSR